MSTAEHLFSQITYGKGNPIPRPVNRAVDRQLRECISQWNSKSENDPIINVGGGYYKPRPWIQEEASDFRQYMAKESSRAEFIFTKLCPMNTAFKRMANNGEEEKEKYEQLSLPLE